jgi:3-oxoacyl-[acyl-carrier protein] reductase
MLLENKNAVIYGAGGSIGSAVARAFAGAGATLFLAGRTLATVEAVASGIVQAGGAAEAAAVDALDERAVEQHAIAIAEKAGRIDISFNAISLQDVQGIPLVDLALADFTRPILSGAATHFLTARAAARYMVKQGSGVILTLSSVSARLAGPLNGGFGVACAAIESLTRNLAGELGPHGIRVVCLRPHGLPETWPDEFRTHTHDPADDWGKARSGASKTPEIYQTLLASRTLLRRLPTLDEVANVATMMASDYTSAMTGVIANITCGYIVD